MSGHGYESQGLSEHAKRKIDFARTLGKQSDSNMTWAEKFCGAQGSGPGRSVARDQELSHSLYVFTEHHAEMQRQTRCGSRLLRQLQTQEKHEGGQNNSRYNSRHNLAAY